MEQIYDVAIVGSGPASLTAAIYTTRGAANTLILGGEKWGGQLMVTTIVDNYPGFFEGVQGPALMNVMRKQAERHGTKFLEENVINVDFSSKPFKLTTTKATYLTKSVIIATGAETNWLNIPGEQKLIGRGVSSCAPCDAPFFKNKKVAVIGGGDAAMEEALVLTKYATEVIIIHRRDQFRASAIMQERVKSNPKIKIIWNTQVSQVQGENKLEKIILKNVENGETSDLTLDGVFVAIGHTPSSKIFSGLVSLDEKGFILTTPKNHYTSATNLDGIFVAGDVHDHIYKQAITAAGFGCMAGLDVLNYLDSLKQ